MDALAEAYRTAEPFPHLAISGFFPDDRIRRVAEEIGASRIDPESPGYGWSGKRRQSNLNRMPTETQALIRQMNGPAFMRWLEGLTGISGLHPDPFLEGGGVHQIARGGYLKVHTDFNWHRRLQMHRRVNVLLYLNEGWQEEWGGHLELHGKSVARYSPSFNRMVIFSTTDFSYHGHPEPLSCPEQVTRNSIALYYYSEDRPAEEIRFGRSALTNYAGLLGFKHLIHKIRLSAPSP